jgi:pseudomonalisin
MRIAIAIARPDPAGEERLVDALHDKAGRQPARHLAPAAFHRRFGVAPAIVRRVRRWLATAGLTVRTVTAGGAYLVATGTVRNVESLTRVKLAWYRHRGVTFLASAVPPRVPARLPVLSVLGLDTLPRSTPAAAAVPARARTAQATQPNVFARTPQDLWSIYEQPGHLLGTGLSVGVLGAGDPDPVIADLHTFDARNGLPPVPVRVVRTPANGSFRDRTNLVEWNIDTQAIHGMAPALDQVVLYFSPTLADPDLLGSLAAWVADPRGPPIMNASFGKCEIDPLNPIVRGNGFQAVADMLLRQAVIEGRTLFASSGDAGSSCRAFYPAVGQPISFTVPLTEHPASSPFAVGVGGTVLYSDDGRPPSRSLEYAWPRSGGNASVFITAPDFQQGVANLNRRCILDSSGRPTNTGRLCRGVPDVAAMSGDLVSNGYAIVSGGQRTVGAGTSLSSALWAGMWARVSQVAGPGSNGYGFANPILYRLGRDAARRAQVFSDVTTGSNGLNPALPGWDYVTGWGTPRVGPLADAVAATTRPRPPTRPAAAPCVDRRRPTSRLTRRRSRASRRGLTVTGTTRDRGCGAQGKGILARVSLAAGRVVGRRCRFLRSSGAFTRALSCSRRKYLPARGTGSWRFTYRGRLPPGRYRLTARAIDVAFNVERVRPGRNTITVRVR